MLDQNWVPNHQGITGWALLKRSAETSRDYALWTIKKKPKGSTNYTTVQGAARTKNPGGYSIPLIVVDTKSTISILDTPFFFNKNTFRINDLKK